VWNNIKLEAEEMSPFTMLKFAVPSHQRQQPVSAQMQAELLDALSEEASHLKSEARVLLKRRRELLSRRKSLLHGQSESVTRR
jgi:hypothetical protein